MSRPSEESSARFAFSQIYLYALLPWLLLVPLDAIWRWEDLRATVPWSHWPANFANLVLVAALLGLVVSLPLWLGEKLAAHLLRRWRYPAGLLCHAFAFAVSLYIGASYVKFLLGLSHPMRPLVWKILIASCFTSLIYLAGRLALWKGEQPTERFPSAVLRLVLGLLGLCLTISVVSALRASSESSKPLTPAASGEQPNIVMLTFDSLSAEYLSLYDWSRPTTPFLETLAQTSTVFDNAITNVIQTRHALPAFMGKTPSPHPVEGEETFGDLLAQAGYRERHFLAASLFTPDLRANFTHFHRFDRSWGYPWFLHLADTLGPSNVLWLGRIAAEDIRFYSLIAVIHPSDLAAIAYDFAPHEPQFQSTLKILSEAPEPVFVWSHFFQPHGPYRPQPGFDFSFGENSDLERYESVIADLDHQVEALVKTLQHQGKWDNTLLILSADHGESFHDGKSQGHGGDWLNDQVVRVPLLIHAPGQTKGQRVQAAAQPIDIVPTLLSHLDRPIPEWNRGESLWPYVDNPDQWSPLVKLCLPGSRFIRSQRDLSSLPYPWSQVESEEVVAYSGRYRLQWRQNYLRDPADPRKVVDFQGFTLSALHDLQTDPGRENNLLLPAQPPQDEEPVPFRPEGEVKALLDRVFGDPTVRENLSSAPWIGPQLGTGL